MILVDANLLIYAVNRDVPQHTQAKLWLEGVLSGSTPVGLPWLVLLAFVRLTTSPRILPHPLSVDEAVACVDAWLAVPVVSVVDVGARHWGILSRLLLQSGAAGNLTSDAHLAALAIEKGATLFSADNDFKRFAGLSHSNPLANEIHEPRPSY